MPATLDYTYGPHGRDRIEFACEHGTTVLRGAELHFTPDAFAATIVRHRSRYPRCQCEPERMIRRWPDSRDALAQYSAMAADVPPELDALDLDVLLRDLADLRANVPCPGCVSSWTAVSIAGGRMTRQYGHAEGCPEYARRLEAGELRGYWTRLNREVIVQ